jgi:hypothetical protein
MNCRAAFFAAATLGAALSAAACTVPGPMRHGPAATPSARSSEASPVKSRAASRATPSCVAVRQVLALDPLADRGRLDANSSAASAVGTRPCQRVVSMLTRPLQRKAPGRCPNRGHTSGADVSVRGWNENANQRRCCRLSRRMSRCSFSGSPRAHSASSRPLISDTGRGGSSIGPTSGGPSLRHRAAISAHTTSHRTNSNDTLTNQTMPIHAPS